MLSGCVSWPEDFAARYRAKGYWKDVPIARLFEDLANRHGVREALIFGQERISFAQMMAKTRRLAGHLKLAGLKPDDRVVLQIQNVPEFVYVFLALMRLGVVPVMALPPHRQLEIGHFLKASGAVGYFIPERIRDFDYRPMAAEMQAANPAVKLVAVAGQAGPGQISLSELLKDAKGDSVDLGPGPEGSDIALMLLSGGTTAISKLIPRTHNDYVYNFSRAGEVAGFGPDTVFLGILPFGHNYTLGSPGIFGALVHGGKVVIAQSTSDEEIFGLIQRERVTSTATAVPLAVNWINSKLVENYDLSSLKVVQCGGARLAPELRQKLRDRLKCIHQEIYGNAEGLLCIMNLDDPLELQLNSSGTPMCEDDEIKVLDDFDHEVADGQSGELVVRGPYTIRGYYNNPDANAKSFTPDGFYRTGDIVKRTGRYVSTEGRKKELINRGGEKISCEEIENLILGNPKVKNVVLVGVKDAVYGEKACAFVIAKPGESIGFEELKTYLLEQKIAKFKLPERLEVVEEFPLSPAGKILRRKLREQIEEKIANETKSS